MQRNAAIRRPARLAFQFRQPLWMRNHAVLHKSLKVSTDFACALSDSSAKGLAAAQQRSASTAVTVKRAASKRFYPCLINVFRCATRTVPVVCLITEMFNFNALPGRNSVRSPCQFSSQACATTGS